VSPSSEFLHYAGSVIIGMIAVMTLAVSR
jgi:hypothetical protein